MFQQQKTNRCGVQANDIEDVDMVLDDIAEQNDQMSQIQDALAQSTPWPGASTTTNSRPNSTCASQCFPQYLDYLQVRPRKNSEFSGFLICKGTTSAFSFPRCLHSPQPET